MSDFLAAALMSAETYQERRTSRWLVVRDRRSEAEAAAGWLPQEWDGLQVRLRPATLDLQVGIQKAQRRLERANSENDPRGTRQAFKDMLDSVLVEIQGVEATDLERVKTNICERWPRLVTRLIMMSDELASGAVAEAEAELGESASSPDGPTG